jgi:hypothetical protein
MNKKLKEKMLNALIDVRNLMIGLLFLLLMVTGIEYIFVFLRL